MATTNDIVQNAASVATAIAVFLAAWQLRVSKKQAITQFEDQMSNQYREIMRRLPVSALLGDSLESQDQLRALHDFYDYFDLSNEQAFLHEQGRITRRTWREWKEGIEQNFARPAFAHAWEEVCRRAPRNFDELRRTLPTLGHATKIGSAQAAPE